MIRKISMTYELPEEIYEIFENRAKELGRPVEQYITELMARMSPPRPQVSPEEAARRKADFEQYIGCWDSGDPNSCDNERIDADLAREYAGQKDED
jgi:hypothetical protein